MGDVTYDDVRKTYDDEVAVESLDIDIRDGEFVTLVGPSGCGKSTSLEAVAGLTEPTDGSIFIDGENVTGLPPKDRDIAMVFQNIALFPHMDVYDNISYGLRLRDTDPDEVDRRVDEAAKMVQMEGMLDRMPDEMSGGQQQRVAIARAIVREPAVFLMDEPLANLDAKLRVHMRTQLQELHRKLDATIIYVTHDQTEAMTMSDRIAVMNDGELQQIGTPLECYYRPKNRFVAGFIGSPSMNFIEGELTEDGVKTPYFTLDIERDLPDTQVGQRVTVGVRPEDITIAEDATFDTESGPVGVRDASEMDGTPSRPIDVITDVIEPVGDDIYVYTKFPQRTDQGEASGAGDASDAGEQVTTEGAEAGENAGDDRLLMSIPPMPDMSAREAVGQETKVVMNLDMVHLFDAETGEAITHGLTAGSDTRGEDQTAGQPTDERTDGDHNRDEQPETQRHDDGSTEDSRSPSR